MATIKSVSGLVLYAKDLKKTADFYEALGFQFRKREPKQVTVNINWYWMDFLLIEEEDKPGFTAEAHAKDKGAGMYIYVSVDNVDEYYDKVIAKGLKPSSQPKDWPWGNREFVMRDPDGYKLVFFKRK